MQKKLVADQEARERRRALLLAKRAIGNEPPGALKSSLHVHARYHPSARAQQRHDDNGDIVHRALGKRC